jgi:hypothetical protein
MRDWSETATAIFKRKPTPAIAFISTLKYVNA